MRYTHEPVITYVSLCLYGLQKWASTLIRLTQRGFWRVTGFRKRSLWYLFHTNKFSLSSRFFLPFLCIPRKNSFQQFTFLHRLAVKQLVTSTKLGRETGPKRGKIIIGVGYYRSCISPSEFKKQCFLINYECCCSSLCHLAGRFREQS